MVYGTPLECLNVPNHDASPGIPGFEGLRWGMHRRDVLLVYPAIEDAFYPYKNGATPYHGLRIEHHVWDRCTFAISFGSLNPGDDRGGDSLTDVSFNLENSLDFEACKGRIKADLMRRLGTKPEEGDWFGERHAIVAHETIWSLPAVYISFKEDYSDQPRLSVTYRDMAPDCHGLHEF